MVVNKKELNELYQSINSYAIEISTKLQKLGYKNNIQFCNINYELVEGKWSCNYFPIPVIELDKIDLNLDMFDKPNYFEFFLKGKQLNQFDFQQLLQKFKKRNLAIYDGTDCLIDYYTAGMTAKELQEKIKTLKAKSIGISFETKKDIKQIVKDLTILKELL